MNHLYCWKLHGVLLEFTSKVQDKNSFKLDFIIMLKCLFLFGPYIAIFPQTYSYYVQSIIFAFNVNITAFNST